MTSRPEEILETYRASCSPGYVVINYVYAGGCTHSIAGEILSQDKNSIVLWNSDKPFQSSAAGDRCEIVRIWVRLSIMKPMRCLVSGAQRDYKEANGSMFAERKYCQVFDGTRVLQSILGKMIQEYYGHRMFREESIYAHLLSFYCEFARIMNFEDHMPKPRRNEDKILAFIRDHCPSATLESVAESFGYSKRQMSRIIRDTANASFPELVNRFRIERACSLIQEKKFPLHEMVSMLGFKDLSYFYKIFQKVTGISYSQYRNRYVTVA
ncbi:MAG: helix-turn-helix transcriptional regulator [Tannerellaceae bacterium]|jgi:AraC-like DNA-binding protein|nr:helix-turn-helix transcriptional regulator [Tannerellaceae bacterium]